MKRFSKKQAQGGTAEEIARATPAVGEEISQTAHQSGMPNKSKRPLTHRTPAKVTAFILVIVMLVLTCVSVLGAIFMVDEDLYTTSQESYKNRILQNIAQEDMQTLVLCLTNEDSAAGEREALQFLAERNIAAVKMTFSDGLRNQWTYDSGETVGAMAFSGTWYRIQYRNGPETFYSQEKEHGEHFQHIGTVEVTVRLAQQLPAPDIYFFLDRLISLAYALRYWIYAVAGASLILAVSSFLFLMCASGRKNGLAEAQPGWGTWIPLDMLTVSAGLAVYLLMELVEEAIHFFRVPEQILTCAGAGIGLLVLALGWCMSVATRLKLGRWWKNTVICYALRLIWLLIDKLWRGLCRLVRGATTLFGQTPLVWKTALCLTAIAAMELFVLVAAPGDMGALLTFWLAKNVVLIPLVLYVALTLRKLQKGGKALASGDLGYQVDTKTMFWDFKRHGENLNRIGEGMTAAVEQRLKSERMKTELITNVSHDIKTPLTSIINYVDLIEKEPCDNPAITEYTGVLHRQSDRLKRLIDDLVEASKASTGNLEILLAPCEVGVMLTQTAGEYEQKLRDRELLLLTSQTEQPVKILADGRRLWRVFDNLMHNVCKYAQRGTRVYLTLEEQNGWAVISVKNISREPLNLSSEELMERFVQGDPSRKSEGNGLGLSIAKSLTELQNGTMELTTDGDLFKVVLRFPTIE